jgi:hypothetical protein
MKPKELYHTFLRLPKSELEYYYHKWSTVAEDEKCILLETIISFLFATGIFEESPEDVKAVRIRLLKKKTRLPSEFVRSSVVQWVYARCSKRSLKPIKEYLQKHPSVDYAFWREDGHLWLRVLCTGLLIRSMCEELTALLPKKYKDSVKVYSVTGTYKLPEDEIG